MISPHKPFFRNRSNASVFDADVGTASHLSSLPKQSCKRWPLRLLTAAAQRRYLLRRSVFAHTSARKCWIVEHFSTQMRSGAVFSRWPNCLSVLRRPEICISSPACVRVLGCLLPLSYFRDPFLCRLVNGNYPMFDSVRSQSAAKQLSSLKLTERWKRRELSNFDCALRVFLACRCHSFMCSESSDLLELNMLASRSYNDITQYPVFPWILTNYTTRCLDLNSPSNYRDLSFPIGALSESQRDSLIDRFESFPDTSIPFHYGTHYSSHTLVCYYLLRLQPFTGLHVDVQGGCQRLCHRQWLSIMERRLCRWAI